MYFFKISKLLLLFQKKLRDWIGNCKNNDTRRKKRFRDGQQKFDLRRK